MKFSSFSFLPLLLLPVTLAAQGSYHSHSFEPPTFKLGQLAGTNLWNGQDGWLVTPSGGSSINPKAISVQSGTVRSGRQAAVWNAALEASAISGHLRTNKIFSFKRLSQELDFRITKSTKPSAAWGIQIQAAPQPSSVMAYWIVRTNGEIWVLSGKIGVSPLTWIKTGVILKRDQWHHARTVFDTATDSMTLFVDGKSVIRDHPSTCGVRVNMHGFTSIVLDGRGNDAFYFDNFAVRSVDPGPLLSVDMDQLAAGRRGRVAFRLSAGRKHANRKYVLLGGFSGSTPGIPLPGSRAVLPVRPDPLTDIIIAGWNGPMFPRFSGTLNSAGEATAGFDSLSRVPTSAVGLKLTFAYALHSPFDVASEAARVEVVK